MEARVGQLPAQRVLPVDAGAHGVCRLPIAHLLQELPDADQGELPPMEGRLAFDGADGGEQLIVEARAHLLAQPEGDVAL
jgi:hypothetical protein